MAAFAIIIPFSLILFFLRDYLLLQMGPARLLSARLRLYSIVFLTTVLLVSSVVSRLSNERILQLSRARAVLPVVVFYAALAPICLWFRGTERRQRGWVLATTPNPLLAICTALLGRLMFSPSSMYVETVVSGFLACVWIGLIRVSLKGATRVRMEASDLDFSLGLACFVNVVAVLFCQPIF